MNKYIHFGDLYRAHPAFWAALVAESRECYPENTADRQPQWALKYYYLLQSTASERKTTLSATAGIRTCDLLYTEAHLSDHPHSISFLKYTKSKGNEVNEVVLPSGTGERT
jgi:hypothetical protein